MSDFSIARRTVIAGAGAGLPSSLVTESSARVPRSRTSRRASIWATRASVKLYLYRKRVAPQPGATQPVLFLVHGSSNFARSSYDLSVAGKGEYSLMNVMAGYGFDVWTMDHDGYGRSGSSGNNSDIASGSRTSRPRSPGRGARPASRSCTCTARRRARSAPAPTRRSRPSGSNG